MQNSVCMLPPPSDVQAVEIHLKCVHNPLDHQLQQSPSPRPPGWVRMHPLAWQNCADEQEGETGTLTLQ